MNSCRILFQTNTELSNNWDALLHAYIYIYLRVICMSGSGTTTIRAFRWLANTTLSQWKSENLWPMGMSYILHFQMSFGPPFFCFFPTLIRLFYSRRHKKCLFSPFFHAFFLTFCSPLLNNFGIILVLSSKKKSSQSIQNPIHRS